MPTIDKTTRNCRSLAALGMTLTALPALAEGPAFSGQAGLLAVPTAEVQPSGTASFGWALHDPLGRDTQDVQDWFGTVGFAPGLELTGRVVEDPLASGGSGKDLSLNAKYRLDLPAGIGLAVGGQDIGGEAQHFRAAYAVATAAINAPDPFIFVTAGYGVGPDVLDGVFGGVEVRPWKYLGLVAEHDTEDFNGGVKLLSPEIWGARLGATAAYRGANSEVEYGAHVEFPLGGASVGAAHGRDGVESTEDRGHGPLPQGALPQDPSLRPALARAGFESVRVGMRDATTQVVGLENRSYNHSAADGVGVALGVIAARADPAVEQIELTLFAYGVPQVTVTAPAALYRAWLDDPAAHESELRAALAVAPSAGIEQAGMTWDGIPTPRLSGLELVIEPALRTFVATEFGLLDYSVGARARLTVPLDRGLLLHLGVQVPLVESDDFKDSRNFSSTGVEGGFDQVMVQYAHKLAPQWTWLWSAGRSQVLQTDLDTLALEQLWLAGSGRHQWRTKLMALHAGFGTRTVALAGYTWFDPSRDYSLSLTGGRFYLEDAGLRVDWSRYFGDTIVGVYFKAASGDDQAGGVVVSLPLTPRRDAAPSWLQVKGARRWSHGLSSTLNGADQRNPLKPLFLYEPMLDLDLREDFYDAGRLGEAYLQDELPRMREAYERWGAD